MKNPFVIPLKRRARRIGPALSNLQEFVREEGGGGILLLIATAGALVWANSSYADSYERIWSIPFTLGLGEWEISKSLFHWINDGLMAIFFFVVGLEIKREVLVGELSKPRQALFPIIAAVGGMVVPALFFTAFNLGGSGQDGWAIPMATDIAFALGILSLLGKRVPLTLKVFLTAVAIVDDIGAVIVIAIFYSHDIVWGSLLLSGPVLMALIALNRFSVRNPLPYALLGVLLWVTILHSGVHATISGVLLALCIPANPRIDRTSFLGRSRAYLNVFDDASNAETNILTNSKQRVAVRELEKAAESVSSPLQRLEYGLHPWVAYAIMPLFALANAGVTLTGGQSGIILTPIGLGVMAGLVLGKQFGIILFSWLFSVIGIVALPRGLQWRHVYGAAWLGGIGFTMSLFISDLAFSDPDLILAAKLGILSGSILSAIGAAIVLLGFRKKL